MYFESELIVKKNLVTLSSSLAAIMLSGTLLIMPVEANSATAVANLVVSLIITANCTITATTLPFGSTGTLTAAINGTATVGVTCTNTTPYNVGLDGGNVTGSTVAGRLLAGTATGNTGTTVPFQLYSDTGRTTVWGNTIGTNTIAGTGSGVTQPLTVYGQVPVATATPQPDTYQSTVVATITF